MRFEKETSVYNEKRYGKPWIARVKFDDTEIKYDFGKWIGVHGGEGLLVIDIEPGEIIAIGQRDFRGKNTSNKMYVVSENGDLESIYKTEAYKHFQSLKSV